MLLLSAAMADKFVDADGKCFGSDAPSAVEMSNYLGDPANSGVWNHLYDMTGRSGDFGGGETALEGDAYLVEGFGTHFDGNGDRVLLGTEHLGGDYTGEPASAGATNGGAGFSISFWFTKEVCDAVQDRWEMLYQHTSNVADPFDMFWSARDAQCVADADVTTIDVDAANCAAVTALEDETACRGIRTADDTSVRACAYRPARGTTSGIALAIGCAGQGSRSTAGGDIVAIRIKDDAGVNPQFDWQLGCAGSDPGLQGTWIHLVLSVAPDSLRVYADGVEQTMFGFPQSWNEEGGASITNPAYPNPASLSASLGSITLQGQASLGNIQGDLSASNFHAGYTGRMAWAQIFFGPISANDAMCIFSIPDLLQSCPETPPASSLDLPLTEASDDVTLRGEATYHTEFGINFDGDGDWAEIAAPDYTSDKSFTINFWASQTMCKIPGWMEPLFVHATNTTAMSQEDADMASQVSVYAVCWRDTPMLSAQVISKNDSPEPQARAGLMASGSGVIQSGGYASSNWLSIGLSVTENSIMLCVQQFPACASTRACHQCGFGVVVCTLSTAINPVRPALFHADLLMACQFLQHHNHSMAGAGSVRRALQMT